MLLVQNFNSLSTERFNAATIPGVRYYLRLFPNGRNENERGFVWFFMHVIVGNETQVDAKFIFSVKSANVSQTYDHSFKKCQGYGSPVFERQEIFDSKRNFFINNQIVIKVNGFLSVQRCESFTFSQIKGGNLAHQLWKKDNKDFTIFVDDQEIQAHKCVIAARSTVLNRMLESGMKEAVESRLEISEFSYEVVKAVIHFFYDCDMIGPFSLQNSMDILRFADKYEVDDLEDYMETYLMQQISSSNVCKLSKYSLQSNGFKLRKGRIEFLNQCLKESNPICDYKILEELKPDAFSHSCETCLFPNLENGLIEF